MVEYFGELFRNPLFVGIIIAIITAIITYSLKYIHTQKEHRFKEYQQLFENMGKVIDRIEKDVEKNSSHSLRMEMLDIYYRISLVNENEKVLKELATILGNLAVIINTGESLKDNIELTDSIGNLIEAVGKELGLELDSLVLKHLYPQFKEQKDTRLEEKQKSDEPQSDEPQYVWINTAVKHFPEARENMLKQNVASTYGPESYGNLLRRVRNKDIILLYHSGTGIIAKGTVDEPDNHKGQDASERKVIPPTTIDDQSENEYQVKVNWDIPEKNESGEIGPIVSASQIKDLGHRMFVPTVQYLDPKVGHKIVKELEKQQTI